MADYEAETDPAPRPQVGSAKEEALLTQAVLADPYSLERPGRGYALRVLDEVEIGLGRPDIVLAVLSVTGLVAWRRRGLRLSNWTEAQVAAALVDKRSQPMLPMTADHARTVTRRLRERGWDHVEGRAVELPLRESVLLEAKVTDWRTGVVQLSRRARIFSRAALLMPERRAHRVPREFLVVHGLGLAVVADRPRWIRVPPRRRPPLAARLWLTELLLEHLEAGYPYGPRCSRLRRRASAVSSEVSAAS